MAKRKKITRKQLLNEPDEFLSVTHRSLQFAAQYKVPILCAVGGFFALLAIIAGYRYLTYRAEISAFELLEEAKTAYDTNAASQTPAQALKNVEPDFRKILSKYSGRDAAKMVKFIYAGLCYKAGEIDTAVELYKKTLSDFDDKSAIRGMILSGLGYCYESKGDYRTAVNYFSQVVEGPDYILKDEALFNSGRMYAKLGNYDGSRKAFQRIVTEYAGSIYSELAREQAEGAAPASNS